MKAKINIGTVIFFVGLLLIVSAAALSLHNLSEEKQAGEQSLETVDFMRQQIGHEASLSASDTVSDADKSEEIVIAPDGERYIGILTIPSLGLELPIKKDLSYAALKTAPCRYSGSVSKGDLVIAAHNYQTHFGTLNMLALGEDVFFTEVSGNTIRYSVAEKEVLKPHEVERMTESDYELTLFTCTLGGRSRVTVRCEKVR